MPAEACEYTGRRVTLDRGFRKQEMWGAPGYRVMVLRVQREKCVCSVPRPCAGALLHELHVSAGPADMLAASWTRMSSKGRSWWTAARCRHWWLG